MNLKLNPYCKNCILFILSFSFCSLHLTAQNIWKGGTPGYEANWNHARNWSKQHVPDWRDLEVIIPNVSHQTRPYPVIDDEVPEIAYLRIESGACLKINVAGRLIINGESAYQHGVQNIGDLYNIGKLIIVETALSAFSEPQDRVYNDGMLSFTWEDYKQKIADHSDF